MRSQPTRIAVGIALALVVACSGTKQAPPQSAAGQPGASTNQINAMSRDRVKDGGTLTWPLESMPVNYNYLQIDGSDIATSQVVGAIMPVPYTVTANGTPVWDRTLLASEPVVVSGPKQVVTYEIHPKAVWSDGAPITWRDFYWEWKAGRGVDKRYRVASTTGYEDIERVMRGKDDREVVVTFARKFADWTNLFNPLYPASVNQDPAAFNDGWKARPLASAGPFRLESIDQTAKTITFVRNEKWWGAPAKLDRIVFRAIEIAAQPDALANGEIDFMDVGPDASRYSRAKSVAAAEMRVAGGPNFRHVTFNGASRNLQDVRVRRAVAMAINRAAIAQSVLGPLGVAPVPLNNHIFMENQRGYQDNSGEVGKFDPAKAAQLLQDAGWQLHGRVRMKDGSPLELHMVIPSATPVSRQEAELMQNMLAQVGVRMLIDTVPSNDFFARYLTPGQYDLTVFSWYGTPYPISATRSIYAKPTRNDKGELLIQQNLARVGSDEIDRLFDSATQELDSQKVSAMANHIDALIWQEVHSVTLYQRPEIYACRKELANFGAFGFASIIYQDIGWAK
jgi:peptide/nickel transport system substrate-binding protein